MLAEMALAVAMASGTGQAAWVTMDAQTRHQRESHLISHKARVVFAMGDFGTTEYNLATDPHIEEANPIAQKFGARVAFQAARIFVMTRGLDELERAGASPRLTKGIELGLVGRDAFLVANNLMVLAGHTPHHQTKGMLLSMALSGAIGALTH